MALSWVSLCALLVVVDGVPFQHDIDYQHPESGEHVKLKSSGHLTDTVDLDRISGIKRVVCQKNKILIAAESSVIAKDWGKGQIIIGSSKWDCNRNTLDSVSKGIYAKVDAVFFPTETGIVVHTIKAGAFDIINEADIKFHYHPGQQNNQPPDVKRRHRRYFANILSELLHNIDWRANFTTTVPWNFDLDKKSNGPGFRIVTTKNDSDFEVQYGDYNSTEDEIFSFACKECHGQSLFSYTFGIVINKNAMNQPDIHHYLSKLETNTSLLIDTSLRSNSSSRIDISKPVLVTAPRVLFTIPVAVVDDARIPPVTLTVNYDSETIVNINMTSSAEVEANQKFNITGSYGIVQEYTRQSGMDGYVTANNWTIQKGESETKTIKDLSLSTSIFQKMNVTTTIGWLARDIDILFSPPVTFKIVPTVTSTSTVDDVRRCTSDTLSVTGDFHVSDARLMVEAFDIPIWDTLLAKGFNRTVNITHVQMSEHCSADCFITIENNEERTPEEVVGKMKHKILRRDPAFDGLHRMVGDFVLFASEEVDTSSWCGFPGRSCVRCTHDVGLSDDNSTCADRMMTSSLAAKTSLLGKYVTAEWPKRKLIVHEAWDEPTSVNPNGEHGNTSLHYEGRAAIYSVSSKLDNSSTIIDVTGTTTTRLEELAVCAGFPFVSKDKNNLVKVAVENEEPIHMTRKAQTPTDSKDKLMFERAMEKLDHIISPDACPDVEDHFPWYWPPMERNEKQACGQPSFKITRLNSDATKSLYEYKDFDVDFENEGKEGEECGHGRECITCGRPSMSDVPWNWCGTRVMTPRMAFRLKRLAVLVKKEANFTGGKIKVLRAFDDKTKDLYNNGRGLKLTFIKSNNVWSIQRLAKLSVCAGFDFVKHTHTDFIEVFVKEQSGYRTTLIPYPSGHVAISVDAPVGKADEFTFPENLMNEGRKTGLIRLLDKKAKLSKHYQIGDFADPSTSYLRVDPGLVECIDTVKDSFGQRIDVIKAFTSTSSSHEVNSEWHGDQLERFRSGQAAVIQHEEQTMDSTMELAKLLMSVCTPVLRMQRRGLALSIRENGLCQTASKLSNGKYCIYVGLYPMERTPQREYVKLSSTVGASKQIDDLKEFKSELTQGGPQIMPYNTEVCKPPELGKDNGYLSFRLNHIGFCLSFLRTKQCKNSSLARIAEADKLWTQLKSTASYLNPDIKSDVHDCLVRHCGGCPGAGPTWDKKVKACVRLVDRYKEYTNKPLVNENEAIAFFNTENPFSSAHALACKNGSRCVENIQLYTLFQTTISSKYKPNPNGSIEELVFDGHDNPSPLLEILEQHAAKDAYGDVIVYIENIRDISALRDVIKVLMIYNRKVKTVRFRTMKNVRKDKVATAIQRKIETWAGGACPKWSRFAVAPYTVEDVSSSRQTRSIHDGFHRNKMKETQRNWEIDWIFKT